MARRNRNLAGLAGLAAMGALMARKFKQEGSDVPVEDRGPMVRPAAPAMAPAVANIDSDLERQISEHGSGIGLTVPDSAPAAPAPGRRRPAAQGLLKTDEDFPPASSVTRAPAGSSGLDKALAAAKPGSKFMYQGKEYEKEPADISGRRNLTLGTPTRPALGAPSIYAGPEAWAEYRRRQAAGMKKGGTVKKMASGGSVSSASKRGDGIAQRGKTRGRMI